MLLDQYRSMPIVELLELPNNQMKIQLLQELNEELSNFPDDFINLSISLRENEENLYNEFYEEDSRTSMVIAPGDILTLHGGIRRSISKKTGTCTFCSERFSAGTPIIYFRPMIWNHSNNQAMILTSKVVLKESCQHYLPSTITELEQMMYYTDHWDEIEDVYAFPNCHTANGNLVCYGEVWHNIGQFDVEPLRKKQKCLQKIKKIV